MLGTAVALFGAAALLFALAAVRALLRGRPLRFALRSLAALVCLVLGGTLGVVSLGTTGLQRLTREETAARVTVRPTAPQRFAATVHFADGHEESFDLAGDDVYVDAHIIKWSPLLNRLGLHTSYRLERIGGRYHDLDQENTALRTVFQLGEAQRVDLAALSQRLPLGALFDAEYGSTTYVPVQAPAALDVQVSTSGLLFRSETPSPR
jgi:hypothetical protein